LFPNHTLLLELPVSFHPPENQGMAPSPLEGMLPKTNSLPLKNGGKGRRSLSFWEFLPHFQWLLLLVSGRVSEQILSIIFLWMAAKLKRQKKTTAEKMTANEARKAWQVISIHLKQIISVNQDDFQIGVK